jgi:small subunit ribosomal protein S4
VTEAMRQHEVVLVASQLAERDVPDYLEADHAKMSARLSRVPTLSEVPYAVQMEPNLVIEFYSR